MKIYIENESIKIDDLGVYCAISYLSNSAATEVLFSTKQIAYVLYGTMDVGRYKMEYVKKHILNLIEDGYINVIQECKGEFVVENTFVVDGINGKFTTITLDELRKIYTANVDANMLLRYFIFLTSTINNDKKCGWYSIDAMVGVLGMHKSTILDYNVILEELGIIYIHRNKNTIKDMDGEYRRVGNTYGRVCDKTYIDKYANEYAMTLGVTGGNGVNINSRSVSKRYNDFVKGVFKGDVDELIEECNRYNKIYMKIGDGDKVKDMSVFDINGKVDYVDEEREYNATYFQEMADSMRLLFG